MAMTFFGGNNDSGGGLFANTNPGNMFTGGVNPFQSGGANQYSGGMFTSPTMLQKFSGGNGSTPNYTGSNYNLGYQGIPQSPKANPSGYKGYGVGSTQDPQLTSQFLNWLQSQIGPVGSELGQMAATGDPTDVGPAWQAMVKAMQQNIQQNQAQLREQFASTGDLASSPFGTAASNFQQQTTLDQNALLGQLQQQASEAAAGRELSAQQSLMSLIYGGSTTYPPYLSAQPSSSPWGGLAQGAGTALGGLLSNPAFIAALGI